MWPECCAPSGGQSDATESAQLVRRDAFLPHYREQRWQSSQWHKLSASVVPNQSGRRALKRSATRSWKRHNLQGNIRHPRLLPHFRKDVCNYYFTTRTLIFSSLENSVTTKLDKRAHSPPLSNVSEKYMSKVQGCKQVPGELLRLKKKKKYYKYAWRCQFFGLKELAIQLGC